jgi:competence protein ComEC
VERWIWGFLIVSISAQLWTSPLVAYYFGRFSCYFLLTNIIVIPLATWLLYLVVAGFTFSLWITVADFFFMLANTVSGFLNHIVLWISSLPGASIEGIYLDNEQLLLIYIALVGIFALFFVTLRSQ